VRLVAFVRLAKLAMDGGAELWRLLVVCASAWCSCTLKVEGRRDRGIEGYWSDAGSKSNIRNHNLLAKHTSTYILSSQSLNPHLQPLHRMT
jgi:hypothetical protein